MLSINILSFAGKLENFDIFTGANNLADRNSYVYVGTNEPFDPNNLPFGIRTYIDHFTVLSQLYISSLKKTTIRKI